MSASCPSGNNIAAKCRPGLKDAKSDVSAEAAAKAGRRYQFERLAYFTLDTDSQPGKPAGQAEAGRRLMFNRTITLKDTWAKKAKKGN